MLQEARELGATWGTDTYRSDVAVISVKEAFIEAYFAPLTDSALPEGVKTADAIAHLEHESCYGRRARVGPTEVCGLCKHHSTFCSRLEQLADAGAAATSPPAPPGYHFFRLEVAKPALFCWCEPALGRAFGPAPAALATLAVALLGDDAPFSANRAYALGALCGLPALLGGSLLAAAPVAYAVDAAANDVERGDDLPDARDANHRLAALLLLALAAALLQF